MVEDSEAEGIIAGFANRRPRPFLQKCRTLTAAVAFLRGQRPVLSKFGIVLKIKGGRRKKRIILDVKESEVGAATRRKYRIL